MRKLDQELFETILDGWKFKDSQSHYTDFPVGAPTVEEIAHLFETAFFASIQREEANFVTFALMFLIADRSTKPRHKIAEHNAFVRFAEPRPLSVEAVKKLAEAIDERSSALAVERNGNDYLITGIIPFGRRPSPLTMVSGGYPRPEALTIIANAPGSLTIGRGSSVIGRFISGELQPAEPTPFHSKALGRDIIGHIEQHHPSYKTFGASYWPMYGNSLRHILYSASTRGHGGTIVWVPKANLDIAKQIATHGHEFQQFDLAYSTFQELLKVEQIIQKGASEIFDDQLAKKKTVETDKAFDTVVQGNWEKTLRATYATLLDAIAKLSCIDGALIISDYFEPVRFGARLEAKRWKGPVEKGPSPTIWTGGKITQSFARDQFGTRHNSAIDFVAAVPGSIAFVLSQDGPVRGITRRNETVYIWPDCLNTIFVN